MKARCLLWDFGDTLVDERFMQTQPPGVPQWTAAWLDLDRRSVLARWFVGELTLIDVATTVSEDLPMTVGQVVDHMRGLCRRIVVHQSAWALTQACPLPQAIVTVNPDLFTTDIVPAMSLERHFEPIVTSWEEHTLDKADLCDIARQRLSLKGDRSEALLIDNKPENIASWRARGGSGYLFESDRAFREDASKWTFEP